MECDSIQPKLHKKNTSLLKQFSTSYFKCSSVHHTIITSLKYSFYYAFFPQTKYFITPSFRTATWSVLRGRTLLHKLLQMNATVDVTPKLSCYYYNCCDPCVTINMTL